MAHPACERPLACGQAPTTRHKRIQDFQAGAGAGAAAAGGAKVFIVTYATAAVGITLTAATRIYLMEPCTDPAAEVQAVWFIAQDFL